MQYKIANLNDIEGVLELHAKYQIDTINEEDKKDGFVTTAFSKEELKSLIEQESGLFIAVDNGKVVAYVMSASWQFWSRWAMFAFMIEDLPNIDHFGKEVTVKNSYQYGPVAIDKRYRGTEVLPNIFNFAMKHMAKRFDYMLTFVNKKNPRSFVAHTKKLKLEVIKEFEYNNNQYWELGCECKKYLDRI